MAVPSALMKPLANIKRLVTRQNDLLSQDALARWMRSGGFERHLRRTRRHYEQRRDEMVACLERARGSGIKLSWRVPDGGMAVWIDMFRDSAKIADRAKAKGIYVGFESEYRARAKPGTGLRLTFARHNPQEIRDGVERLMAIVAT